MSVDARSEEQVAAELATFVAEHADDDRIGDMVEPPVTRRQTSTRSARPCTLTPIKMIMSVCTG